MSEGTDAIIAQIEARLVRLATELRDGQAELRRLSLLESDARSAVESLRNEERTLQTALAALKGQKAL